MITDQQKKLDLADFARDWIVNSIKKPLVIIYKYRLQVLADIEEF